MKRNSGNALWFILIAIFLLGGLTVLLTRTGSQTEEMGDTERSSIKISEIFKYVQGIESAVTALRMRGCSEQQISFDYPNSTDYDNPFSPPDHSCEVFHENGGGLTFKPATYFFPGPYNYIRQKFSAQSSLIGIGTEGCGTAACNDLYWGLRLESDEAPAVCAEVNKRLGNTTLVPTPITTHLLLSDDAATNFKGTYGPYHNAGNTAFRGLKSACFIYSSVPAHNQLIWYYVLMRR